MSASSLEELLHRLRGSPESSDSRLAVAFPPEKIAEIKKRELKRFKAAQDKKWRNWTESVSR
jgi:hypothetical protein